ncbi:hypothetical protein PVAND_008486 [Polypedilum vanderplanki]|uniref:Uncharacterized protein n=1 Tax=Polypedilum vanderplanki TaxID=319348 RepID=A0A9J6CAC9_POLVA|nr:hypothetical protein PVAND_008486 [Polypedilum vanderplanki]
MDKKKSVKFKDLKKVKRAHDLSQCLPPSLYDRVAKLIPLNFPKNDSFEEHKKLTFRELLETHDPELLKQLGDDVTEENFADLIEMYQQAKQIVLNIEERVPDRKLFQKDVNWMSGYLKKTKKERIIWQTKLFKDNREIYERPLFEQTEELIDIAADHFAVWLKQMDEESNIQKEHVKQLFSIQVEADASKALHVEPKEINAVPHGLAKFMKLPEFSMQNKVFKMFSQDKELRKRPLHTVAFGRCVPRSMRVAKFNEELFDDLYHFACPPRLQSLEIVFDKILHLKSTQALVEYLKKNPDKPRAKFLIDNHLFDENYASRWKKDGKPL